MQVYSAYSVSEDSTNTTIRGYFTLLITVTASSIRGTQGTTCAHERDILFGHACLL